MERSTPGKHCRVGMFFRDWNCSSTNCSGFLHRGLMAHKENALLKCAEEMYLLIYTGKGTSRVENLQQRVEENCAEIGKKSETDTFYFM